MKISTALLSTLLSMSGLSTADDSPLQYFGAISARSASPIHLLPVSAAESAFWLGRETQSYCPSEVVAVCPPGNVTLFAYDVESDITGLSLAVGVPGGQLVYVAEDGALGFTQAHTGMLPPGNTNVTGFTVAEGDGLGGLSWGEGFVACPTDAGPWKIYAQRPDTPLPSEECLGFSMVTSDAEEIAAFQYV